MPTFGAKPDLNVLPIFFSRSDAAVDFFATTAN